MGYLADQEGIARRWLNERAQWHVQTAGPAAAPIPRPGATILLKGEGYCW